MLQKKYVPALIRFDEAGGMVPVSFQLREKWWEIEQIYEKRRMPFSTGGAGVRYTIQVGKSIGHIMYDAFLEPLQWFIELDMPAQPSDM